MFSKYIRKLTIYIYIVISMCEHRNIKEKWVDQHKKMWIFVEFLCINHNSWQREKKIIVLCCERDFSLFMTSSRKLLSISVKKKKRLWIIREYQEKCLPANSVSYWILFHFFGSLTKSNPPLSYSFTPTVPWKWISEFSLLGFHHPWSFSFSINSKFSLWFLQL